MGWASGLQAGLQLGRAFKEGQERRAMEEIQKASANEIQDYGTAGTQQIQGLQASGAYDVQAVPGAEGTAPTLRYTPKQGLDLQGDTPAPAGAYIDVAPQRMTEFLGQRYEGGLTPERMESLRTRAMANAMADPMRRQQALQGIAAEERAQEVEGRAKKQFETQNEAALLTIEEQRRLKKERDDAEARQKKLSQDWSDRLATKDADGNVIGMRPPNDEDLMWSAQRSAQELAAAGKTQEALGAYKDFVIASEAQIKKQGVDRGEAIKRTAKLVNDGNYDALKDFYDKYVPDGAKVQEYKVNKDGTIIVKRVDLNGQPLPDVKTTKLELIQGLVSFENPEKLATYAQQSFTNAMTSRQVAATESRAASANKTAGLNEKLINARIDNLNARTTALNEPPKLTEAQVTQRARVMVTNRERNPATGKPYTMGEATEAVKAGKASNPIADALDRALGGNVDPFEAE